MRRLQFLLIVICLLSVGDVQAQMRFGVTGGLQLTDMSFNADALRKSNRAGFFIGPTLRISTKLMGVGVDVSALYDNRDLKVDGKNFHQQSFVVPANVRLGATMFDRIGVMLLGGPQLSFNIGEDVKQWTGSDGSHGQFALQTTTLSVNLGVGALVGNIEGRLFYNVPLGKTGDFTWDNALSTLQSQTWNHAKSTTNAWRLAVTYYF